MRRPPSPNLARSTLVRLILVTLLIVLSYDFLHPLLPFPSFSSLFSSSSSRSTAATAAAKQDLFTRVLKEAKKALDISGVAFHIHSGTALGAIRSGQFIDYDEDIDIGIFQSDYQRKMVAFLSKQGFTLREQYGRPEFGLELSFIHRATGVKMDAFLVYNETIKGRPMYWVSSFNGRCSNRKYKMCRWSYRPYIPHQVTLNGIVVNTAPESALEDSYGPTWSIPKKFGYFEGIEQGLYFNLIEEEGEYHSM